MKKNHVPVLVAVALIVVVVLIGVSTGLLEKYSYSNERADLNAYFNVSGGEETAIIYNDTRIEEDAIYRDGHVYFPFSFVDQNLNNHFYYDMSEQQLLFTTDSALLSTAIGSTDYTFGGEFVSEAYALTLAANDTVYLADEFIKRFSNFSCQYFGEPNRVLIDTVWDEERHATVKKDTQVRVLGGVKSEILADLQKGDDVRLVEEMDTWSLVTTYDGISGYVENKRIEETDPVTPAPVTDYVAPAYAPLQRDGKICLVWNMVTNKDANAYAQGLLDSTQGVNVISPTWFALSDDYGDFSSLADAGYVSAMHNRGIQVWALLDNFTNKEVSTADVVNNTTSRRNLINGLISTALEYNLDGINVDFESVSADAAKGYIQFLRELYIECHKNGIILSADNGYLLNYDRGRQGEAVDYVIIMGYDEHVAAADGVGSNASIDFVQSGIEKTVSQVPSAKVINAIPFYTRLWTTNGEIGQVAYGMNEIENFLNANGATTVWDDAACQYKAQFSVDGTNYEVWLEESESIAVKLNIMSQYDLAGIAGWRLGQEKADIWNEIAAYLQQ
ncbi:MAG: glycosyl hydrolase family 18 protein [Lachnospiraceae bacterium]|nr:glycosyl hydrolase family 18 protein [Lachnospiraceae bacterium]